MSQELVEVARLHAEMAKDLLEPYDERQQAALGRYAAFGATRESLQIEQAETQLFGEFVNSAVGLFPFENRSGEQPHGLCVKSELEAQHIVDSIVVMPCPVRDLVYLIGNSTDKIVISTPRIDYGKQGKGGIDKFVLEKDWLDGISRNQMDMHFSQAAYDGQELSHDDLEQLYSTHWDTFFIEQDRLPEHVARVRKTKYPKHFGTPISRNRKTNKLPIEALVTTITGTQMVEFGIPERLLTLAIRFGKYPEHVALLGELSERVADIRGDKPERRQKMIVDMMAMVRQANVVSPPVVPTDPLLDLDR